MTNERSHSPNINLDERKQKILQAVVWHYVETAEPVGSENLAQRYAEWGVKSATIRNALADLADLGYLRQPHTSAGRIPSDQGYRFYVDHLMTGTRAPGDEAMAKSREEMEERRAETLERILRQTCALLTQMTRYTAVATPPQPSDIVLRQLFAAPAGPDALLIVAMLSTGGSEHRILTGEAAQLAGQEPAALTQAMNAVNAAFAGATLDILQGVAPGTAPSSIPSDLNGHAARSLYLALAESARQIARSVSGGSERPVVEGATEILRHPEFQDVAKLEGVLDALQTRAAIGERPTPSSSGGKKNPVSAVVIGRENPLEPLQECSVVTAYYYIGTRERGTLGVVGPTRMDYDRAVPAVSLMAKSLSDLLTRLA